MFVRVYVLCIVCMWEKEMEAVNLCVRFSAFDFICCSLWNSILIVEEFRIQSLRNPFLSESFADFYTHAHTHETLCLIWEDVEILLDSRRRVWFPLLYARFRLCSSSSCRSYSAFMILHSLCISHTVYYELTSSLRATSMLCETYTLYIRARSFSFFLSLSHSLHSVNVWCMRVCFCLWSLSNWPAFMCLCYPRVWIYCVSVCLDLVFFFHFSLFFLFYYYDFVSCSLSHSQFMLIILHGVLWMFLIVCPLCYLPTWKSRRYSFLVCFLSSTRHWVLRKNNQFRRIL